MAPFMHDGSLETLEEVIEFYNRGGNPNSHLDPELRALELTAEEKRALLELLKNLSGTIQEGIKSASEKQAGVTPTWLHEVGIAKEYRVLELSS